MLWFRSRATTVVGRPARTDSRLRRGRAREHLERRCELAAAGIDRRPGVLGERRPEGVPGDLVPDRALGVPVGAGRVGHDRGTGETGRRRLQARLRRGRLEKRRIDASSNGATVSRSGSIASTVGPARPCAEHRSCQDLARTSARGRTRESFCGIALAVGNAGAANAPARTATPKTIPRSPINLIVASRIVEDPPDQISEPADEGQEHDRGDDGPRRPEETPDQQNPQQSGRCVRASRVAAGAATRPCACSRAT